MVTTSQVITLLENVLFESPTLAAANAPSWVAKESNTPSYATLSGMTSGIASSPEISIVEQVVRYYEGALGRAPGGFEIQYYVNIAEQGLTAAQIAQGASAIPQSNWDTIASDFANSPEFTFIASGSNAVSLLYFNILHRIPGPTEIAYYNDQLIHGFTVGTLVQEFTNSSEYQTSVNGTIQGALANYGLAVLSGTTPTTIPLLGANQQIEVTLTGTDVSIAGKGTTQTVTVDGTPASAGQTAVTAVTGVIAVAGVTAATGVQGVTAVTAVAPVAGQSAIAAASDGAVTITDAAFSSGGAGTITTITLNSSGANSIINDNALINLTLSGTAGSLTINDNGSNDVLNLTVNGLTNSSNAITDTKNEIKTLDITTTGADSTLAAFADTKLTTINLSGTNALTLSAINSSLTALNVTGSAGFSDGATSHTGGLAALGSALTISLSSSGIFSAALDDTKQSFTGGPGTDIIMVGATVDATQTLTAGSAANNEILFEGGVFGLTSASTGKFVNFQTVGVAANVGGTIDLSVVDATATGLHVYGANGITFTKVASGATLTLDPSTGATISLATADSTGASDAITVAMSSDVAGLSLKDSAGTGIATVSIVNNLKDADTNVSAAHVVRSFDDTGLSTLNVSGDAGLDIPTLTLNGASFTLANDTTNGRGVTLDTFTDDALTALNFSGAGAATITTMNSATTTLAIANTGSAIVQIGILTSALTSLTLSDNVALGQAATPDITNGLQDSSTGGVTIAGQADNAHVTVNLLAGAATGNSDSITLGNGNNIVADSSTAGTVTVTLGSGANLVELGSASGDTTGAYSVTLAARTAAAPNIIVIGTAGTKYDTAANLQITGLSNGDIIAFGDDTNSSSTALTATSLTAATSDQSAIHLLEVAATAAHRVVYGNYNGNTYLVETNSGILGGTDTTVVEIMGTSATQVLTASAGYVTMGSTASTMTTGALTGGGFTILAGTATNLTLKSGLNVVTMTGPSSGVTDTFSGIAAATGLIVNYQADSGNDTVNLSSLTAVKSLTVNDLSTSNAGITIGSFTDNALTTVTYNNQSAAAGSVITQQALTSSSLSTINFTGSTNTYFFTGNLTTQGGLTINDSNTGSETTTMGLNLAGGPNALTLNMTGAGTLATGVLTDDNLAALTLTGSGTFDVGTLVDAMTGAFTLNDNGSSSSTATVRLSGLSAATSLSIVNSSGTLTDNSVYSDAALATLNLTNNGSALTVGGGGITANALKTISIDGAGPITIGALADSVSGPVTITDTNTGAINFPLSGLSAATSLTVADNAASGSLAIGALADNSLAALSLTSGGGTVTVDSIATQAASFTLSENGSGTLTVGAITDNNAATLTLDNTTAAATISVTDSAAAIGLNLTGSGTGTDAVSLTLGTTALTVNDSSSSTGDATVTIPSASGEVTSASLTNTGHGALTVTGLVNGTAGGFTGLTFAGSGQITTDLNVLDTNSTVTIADGNSGQASVSSLTLGDATTVTGTLAVTNSGGGTLTIGGTTPGTIYVTTLTLAATGSSSSDITLSDLAAGAVTVTLSGTGRQTLNFTHSGVSGDLITLGAGPSTVVLNDVTASVTVGTGIADITLGSGHTAGSTLAFSAASASTANNTPVTTDIIRGFLLDDGGMVQGDLISSGFAAGNILTTADVNPSGTNFWTSTNGMLSKPGASLLNFIAQVQSATQAGGVANTNGIAGFLDGQGNTWIAFNDHAGDVSVIELTGLATTAGLEAGATNTLGYVHIG